MKKWCRHFRLDPDLYGRLRWWSYVTGNEGLAPRNWRFCPICGKPRPVSSEGKG